MIKKLIFTLLFTFVSASTALASSFYIESGYDVQGRSQIEATKRFTSDFAKFYIDNTVWKPSLRDDLQKLGNEFDENIYNQMRQTYGAEWKPGIDNDQRIIVLLTPMIDKAGGYFNPHDGYTKKQLKDNNIDGYTNEKDMIYLNSNNLEDDLIFSYLAHEFQHLINFYQKNKLRWVSDPVWFNEALSEYAPTLCGYNDEFDNSYLASRVEHFQQDPSNSLTSWQGSIYDYAPISLFMHYLVGQYGEKILTQMEQTKNTGLSAIANLSDNFNNWVITNYLNDCNIEDGLYCYNNENLDFTIGPTSSYNLAPISTLSVGSNIEDWSPSWYKISGLFKDNQSLQIDFAGQQKDDSKEASNFYLPYLVFNKDNSVEIKSISLDKEKQIGSLIVYGFGQKVNSVVLMPVNHDLTPDDDPSQFSFVAKMIKLPAPLINKLSVKQVDLSGAQDIILYGQNFKPGVQVLIGAQPAQLVEFLDTQTISFSAPQKEESGQFDIMVINPDGQQAKLHKGLEYIDKQAQRQVLLAQIVNLQEQVNNLQKQLNHLLARKQAIKANYLSWGSSGEEVKKLQKILNKKGFSVGIVDGIFGAQTRQAVINFQQANQLEADGIVGPQTKQALNNQIN